MIITVIVVLILAALALWAAAQFPMDAVILRLIRVVIVVAAVLFLLQAFGLLRGVPGLHR